MTFVKRIAGTAVLGVATLVGSGLSAPPAQAGFLVTLQEVGSNVVATGSGTLDVTDLSLTFNSPVFSSAAINPSFGVIGPGPTTLTEEDEYTGVAGPARFGTGGPGAVSASSGSGNHVAIIGAAGELEVPHPAVSGTLIDSATWDNATFASLGVTPGTYEWTWGSGAHADSFTLQIGPAAVPEPSSLLLLALPLGLFMLLAAQFRRSQRDA